MARLGFALQILSAVLALVAGALWWQSTRVAPPERVTWTAIVMDDAFGLRQTADGFNTFPVHSNGFNELVAELNAQSRWNRYAAYAATAAAVVQGVANLIPTGPAT